ncbi:3-oxoacyl-reductase [Dendrothele bispora CBS 962.96]|uniref:3-oxoacyl-reductase n=1 Tax=Dendrothele bispora (strain CBS 962.96) TaxID=1314807 RepID=A0A4S8LCB2_DENBC|nr:3-oxoacyl-reductase [Dendrothele bispora CBS 962.96]
MQAARSVLASLRSGRALASHQAPVIGVRFSSSAASPRSAIVTGAAEGIGRAIAIRLAQDGFDVCVNDLQHKSSMADDVAKEIKSMGRNAFVAYGDVSKRPDVDALVKASVKELGPLNVMVANAGIAQVKAGMEMSDEDMRRMCDVNIFGVVNCTVASANQFIEQGQGGKIINAASIVAFKPFLNLPIYSASKAAVRSLTHSFAMELAHHKITVNAYAPGVVKSSMWELIDEGMSQLNGLPKWENFQATEKLICLGRTSVPTDVSKAVSFLAGPDSDYMTGQTIIVDGGMIFS